MWWLLLLSKVAGTMMIVVANEDKQSVDKELPLQK
jgi:hypothetical protein